MHNLKIVLLTAAFIITGCSYKGASSPQGAFKDMRIAFEKKDPALFAMTISAESYKKFESAAKLTGELNETAFKEFCEVNSLNHDKAHTLSVKDYIRIYLNNNTTKPDTLFETLKSGIADENSDGKRASVKANNGAELYFLKEGSYWKLDMRRM